MPVDSQEEEDEMIVDWDGELPETFEEVRWASTIGSFQLEHQPCDHSSEEIPPCLLHPQMTESVKTGLHTHGPDYLSRVYAKYLGDEVYMLNAVHFVPADLAALRGVLSYASLALRGKKDFVAKVVAYRGRELEYASPDLKDDVDIVSLAIDQDGNSLRYASERLQENEDIVKRAIEKAPSAIRFVARQMRALLQRDLFQLPDDKPPINGGAVSGTALVDIAEEHQVFEKDDIGTGYREDLEQKLPKILMSVRFDFIPSASAIPTAVHKELCNNPYFKKRFHVYDPNLVSKGFCGPKQWITSVHWPCRGNCIQIRGFKCPCLPIFQRIGGSKPTDASCWRRSYRWHQEDACDSGGFMLQIEELTNLAESDERRIAFELGKGQDIEARMASMIGMKVYRAQVPSVTLATVAVKILAERLQAVEVQDAEHLLEIIGMQDLLQFCSRHRATLKEEDIGIARAWAGNKVEEFCIELLILHHHVVTSIDAELLAKVEEPIVEALENSLRNVQASSSAVSLDLEKEYGKLAERVYPPLNQLQFSLAQLSKPHLVSRQTSLEYGLLHFAAIEDLEHVLNLLLSRQADPQLFRSEMKNYTPLHAAAEYNKVKALSAILDARADVNVRNRGSAQVTPLHVAAGHTAPSAAMLLLQRRAEVDPKDAEGATPLHHAAFFDCFDVAKLLLENGASLKAQDKDGYTPGQVMPYQNGTTRTRDSIAGCIKNLKNTRKEV